MPRQLENDRWLFGVTLALCLLGAVMVFSASAVTAEHQYGRSLHFSAAPGGLAGHWTFRNVCVDARWTIAACASPQWFIPRLCVVLLMLVGAFFLDKSHATHRWIKFGPVGIQPSELAKLAVILYLAWFLDMKRRSAAQMEFCKDDFAADDSAGAGPDPDFAWH